MKIQYCIFILLVCFTSCKNISSKQGETMAASLQDSLKDPRYDSIISFDAHHMYERVKEGKKYYLHKDSLFVREKDTFYCREYHSYFDTHGNIRGIIFYRKVPLMSSHRGITRSAEVGLSLKRL